MKEHGHFETTQPVLTRVPMNTNPTQSNLKSSSDMVAVQELFLKMKLSFFGHQTRSSHQRIMINRPCSLFGKRKYIQLKQLNKAT